MSSSWAQIRGTSTMPRPRAAAAGKSLCRSGVAVNQMLIRSSATSSLRSRTAVSSSPTHAAHVPGLVPVQLDRAPDRSYRHVVLLARRCSAAPSARRSSVRAAAPLSLERPGRRRSRCSVRETGGGVHGQEHPPDPGGESVGGDGGVSVHPVGEHSGEESGDGARGEVLAGVARAAGAQLVEAAPAGVRRGAVRRAVRRRPPGAGCGRRAYGRRPRRAARRAGAAGRRGPGARRPRRAGRRPPG